MRAKISAFLSNNPGEHFTQAVAAHLEISPHSAGQMLGAMARDGLIPLPGKGKGEHGSKKTWRWQADMPAPAPTPAPAAASVAPIVRPSHTGRASVADEVELVLGGTTLIVGRNEITGRIRIIVNA